MLSRALENFRVVDLTKLYPGPLCTLMLADLGADVVKVEAPGGEMGRLMPPFENGESILFSQLNRNKRSLILNLKRDSAIHILKKLLADTDVLIESFRPGVMNRLGLDYATLSKQFPALVYCSVSGFGQEGPDSQRPAHDLNYISIAGVVSTEGSGACIIPSVQIADTIGAFQSITSILAALLRRFRTGQGAYLDISLLDGAFLTMILLAGIQLSGRNATNESLLSGRLACYNVYQTSDRRYLAIGLLEPHFWKRFCVKMNLPDFVDRQYHHDQQPLIEAIRAKLIQKTLSEWLQYFHSDDLCVSPVNTVAEAMQSPYLEKRNLFIEIDGKIQMKTPLVTEIPGRKAPSPGEHSREILQQLGYSQDEIAKLQMEGAI